MYENPGEHVEQLMHSSDDWSIGTGGDFFLKKRIEKSQASL